MERKMSRIILVISVFLVCNISSAIHFTVEWTPNGLSERTSNLKSVLINTSIEEREGFVSFTIIVSENPDFKDGEIYALSKYSFGELEVFDENKKLADISLDGNTDDGKRKFIFKVRKELLNNSKFTFRAYPVDPKAKDPQMPMYSTDFSLKLINFYNSHLRKDMNKTNSGNGK